jgi:hypothetical protein
MSETLDTMYPGRDVVAAGETIRIRPFKTKQMREVLAIVLELLPVYQKTGGNVIAIALMGVDQCIRLAAMASGKTVEWIDDLDVDESMKLMVATLEENWNFFEKKVIPEFGAITAMFKAKGILRTPQTDGDLPSQS